MKNSINKNVVSVLTMIGSILLVQANAQPAQDKMMMLPRHESCLKKLKLTDEQKSSVRSLREQQKELRQQGMKSMSDAMPEMAAMDALMVQPQFDEAKAKELLNNMSAQHMDKRIAMLKGKHALFQILTPEQQKELIACTHEMKGKKNKGMPHQGRGMSKEMMKDKPE